MKKQFLTIFLLSCVIFANAQENKTYYQEMKLLLNDLDSTKFKNNILYDKVYPLSKLYEFNQDGRKDTSNFLHFKQAVHELNIVGKHQTYFSTEMLEQRAISSKAQNRVLIGIINTDMTILREDIFDENDLKMSIDSSGQNKKYIEIPDKDPYKHIQSLVISPLQGIVEQETGNNVTFDFKKAFIQLSTNPIKNMNVDFGNGQNYSIIENRTFTNPNVTHNFISEGKNILKFTGNYQDGTNFETFAIVHVDFIQPIGGIYRIRATETFTPYEPDYYPYNFTPTNLFSEVEYKVYYSTNPSRTKIMKPIIITDGIDYGGTDERYISDIYNKSLKLVDGNQQRLGDNLRALGFDVIIVNYPKHKIGTYTYEVPITWDDWGYPEEYEIVTDDFYRQGGADYIQRNAKALKQLIRHINTTLTTNNSSEELVVVGPSMGGMVTRWALKEMENAGENHNTRLWVSFDAPHQGANIPLSLQFLADYSDDYNSTSKLKREAAKQMLVHHYLDAVNNEVDGGAPNFGNRFKNELNGIGYPNNVRKIALVNGSTNGISNNQPGEDVAYVYLWMASFPWGNAGYGYLNFSSNQGTNQVFKFKKRTGLSSWQTKYKYVNTNNSIGSYDTSPGCKITMTGDYSIEGPIDLIKQHLFLFFHVWIDGNITQYVNDFTFMPTKSTLDFQGNTLLREKICNRDLVISNETPFDAYYAPEESEDHVTLNTDNVAWLLNELNGTPENNPSQITCTEPLPLSISGPSFVCYPESALYTLTPNNIPNVYWEVTNGIEIIEQTNSSIEIQFADQLETIGTISAAKPGYVTAEKEIICHPIHPQFILDYTDDIDVLLSIKDQPNEVSLKEQVITNVEWNLTSGNAQILNFSNEQATISGSDFTGNVTVTNSSGNAVTHTFFWPDPDKCKAIIKVGTDKYQIIDRCNNNQIVDVLAEKELYSAYGYKLSDLPLINLELELNTGNPGDIQLIRVNTGDEELTKRIIKD